MTDTAPASSRFGPALLAASRIWVQLVNAAVLFAVTLALDPERFGAFMIAASAQAALAVLVGHGVYEYVIKERDRALTAQTAFAFTIASAFAAALLALALSFALTRILDSPSIGALLRWLAPIFFVSALTVFMESVMIRDGRMSAVAVCTMIADGVGLVLALSGLAMGAGVYALVLQRAGREITLAALFAASGRWRPRFGFAPAVAADMARFAGAIVSTRFIANGGQMAMDVSIGALLSVADAGLFRLANRILLIGWDVLYQPLRTSLWARLPQLKHDAQAYSAAVTQQTEIFALGVFALIGGIALIAADALPLAFGPEWTGATVVILVIAIARLLAAVTAPAEVVFGVANRTGMLAATVIGGAALNLVSVFVGAPFGLFWTGVAHGAALIIAAALFFPAMAREAHIAPGALIALWARLSVNALVMAGAVLIVLYASALAGLGGWPRIAVAVAAGAVAYMVAARTFTPRGYAAYADAFAAALARLGVRAR
ncbi:MAG: oligosaccharide flippase family protein [Hyphomonadaceae bacterium]|nr:oligosaccharide flippase family protein [Hyphomonadaceae bacterium]